MQNAELAKDATKSVSSFNTPPAKADWDKVLKKGSIGVEVEILQTALKTLVSDGNFGDLTQARLKKVMNELKTEEDVQEYVDELKKALLEKIKDNKRISL